MAKTFAAFLRRADEGTLSRLLVESSILLAASRGNPASVLKDAATAYKVDTDAIAAKVRQEFAAKEKAKKATQPAAKGHKESGLAHPFIEGRHSPPLISSPAKIAQGEPVLVSPCTLIPPGSGLRSPAAR